MTSQRVAILLAFFAVTSARGVSEDADFAPLLHAGKTAEVESLARDRLTKDPKDDVALWQLGRLVSPDAKLRDELIARAEQCTRERPQSARCHSVLGHLYAALASSGSMSAGIKYAGRIKSSYVRAVELDPTTFAFRRDLNQYYLNAPGIVGGSVAKAIQASVDYSKVKPALGQVLRSEVHTYEEEFDEAESMLAAIEPGRDLEVADAVRAAFTDLGLALIGEDQAQRAQKLFERLVADNPGYANGHFGLGRALLAQQQFDLSIAALDRALELDPRVRAHYRLGIAYQGKGDTTKAVAMFRQFLSYSSGGRAADDARKRLDALTTKRG